MDPRFFQPPPDTTEDDPNLPAGTIEVTIKDAADKAIPNAPVTLGILHSSVAKGESRERKSSEANAEGVARFTGLELGSGVTYRVTTSRGQATYGAAPFALGDKVGKRVVVHSYEVSSDIDEVAVALQGVVYVALREDALQVEQLYTVFNLGPVSWAADARFALPAGYRAFNKQDTMGDTRVDEVKDTGAALRGTFSPGRHDVDFRYQVPLDNEERQTFRIELPPHLAHMRVMVESSKSMGVEVDGFPAAQQVKNREGKRVLITEKQVMRAEDSMQMLQLTITGLPTKGWARWAAVALAVLALGLGLAYVFNQPANGALDTDSLRDLKDAREALLSEIVALERAHRSGEIGPKTYERLRGALMSALARIVDKLESDRAQKRGASRSRREARPAESS